QSVAVTVPPPVASFTYSCNLLSCTFNDTSTAPSSSITYWSWSFGDGGSYLGQFPPAHWYSAPGTYLVQLTVRNSFGTYNTTTQNVTVTVPPPNASFTAWCSILNCTFSDTSTDSNGYVVSWSWDFGDGTTGYQSYQYHSYSAPG